jgi:hypothetical protein
VDKKEALENLDLILLCLDEIVDGGYAICIFVYFLFPSMFIFLFLALFIDILSSIAMPLLFVWVAKTKNIEKLDPKNPEV